MNLYSTHTAYKKQCTDSVVLRCHAARKSIRVLCTYAWLIGIAASTAAIVVVVAVVVACVCMCVFTKRSRIRAPNTIHTQCVHFSFLPTVA